MQPKVAFDVGITEARARGGVGNPRGLTVYVVPGPRDGRVRPDPGPHPGRPVCVCVCVCVGGGGARGESSKILTLKQQKNRDRRFLPPLLPCILLTRRVQMRLGGRLRRQR